MLGAASVRLLMLALLLLLGGWISQSDPVAPFGRLSWWIYDSAQSMLHSEPRRDARIVIVDIDDATLQEVGRWPWPRERFAELLDRIQEAEPAVLGLDILLPDPTEHEADLALAERLARDDLVIAMAFGDIQSSEIDFFPSAGREVRLHYSLASPGERMALGHISPQVEGDGRIRTIYPRICHAGECYSTLSLAMLERWVGYDAALDVQGLKPSLCVAGFCQWLGRDGRLLIPFHHPSRFDYLSATEVMDGEHREALVDSMVLVGTSAAGLGDLVATPRGALTPGVELHAVLLASWLDSYRWRSVPYARIWQLLGLAIMAAAVIPNLGSRRTRYWHWMILTCVAAVLLMAPLLLLLNGWWLGPAAWWWSVLAAVTFWLGWERWQLWRRHRRLYRAFGSYVPHGVLRRLAEEGGEHQFLPQRRPLVILFSDIRGFTTLSERLSPERLTILTNHIFTELTDEVHRHGGTLDKYIGDALMAFWGAPIVTGSEARQAFDCANAMHERLEQINAWCKDNDFPTVAMNIGLEAGEVTVGNLGSSQRRTYTAMGNAVNIAARLEELAGLKNEPVLLGPTLARALEGSRGLSSLGMAHLKGLSKPIALWKPAELSLIPCEEKAVK